MDREEEINLREFFSFIKERYKLIILITIMVTIAAGFYSKISSKATYETQSSIIVLKGKEDTAKSEKINVDQMYQNLVQNYSELAKSNVVAENASKKLNNKISAAKIKGKITITPQPGTQFIYIKVKGETGKEAFDIATAFSEAFVEEANVTMDIGSAKILDKATMPGKPVKQSKTSKVIAAFFIGLLGSMGLAFLLDLFDNRIKTKKNIEKYVGIRVIGVIPNNKEE